MNQCIIVGRLVSDLEIKETENGKKVSEITIAVPRPYKNEDGEYEIDYIPVIVWNIIAENTKEYCKKGDMIGVKGRIENYDDKVVMVADKITFLSSRKPEEKESEEE